MPRCKTKVPLNKRIMSYDDAKLFLDKYINNQVYTIIVNRRKFGLFKLGKDYFLISPDSTVKKFWRYMSVVSWIFEKRRYIHEDFRIMK